MANFRPLFSLKPSHYLCFLLPLLLCLFLLCIHNTELSPEVTTSFREQCLLHNYPIEEYSVLTEDNYILTLYRIPGKGPPVLFLHGLLNSANVFIINQCGASPGFILADAGYDVWFANFRGSHLSRKHLYYDQSTAEYWDWSFQELLMYDFPASVRHVKEATGYPKIAVIGYSLGGSVVLNAVAMFPEELGNHIDIGILLTTPGGVVSPQSYYMQLIRSGIIPVIFGVFGVQVFMDWSEDTFMPKLTVNFKEIVKFIAKDIMDLDINGGKAEDMAVYAVKTRGGTSMKSISYLGQYMRNRLRAPRMYDYGLEENLMRYGKTEPPAIYYSNITLKIAIFNAEFDRVVSKTDSLMLKEDINEKYLVHYRDDIPLDHAGLLFACNMTYFDEVLEVLETHFSNIYRETDNDST